MGGTWKSALHQIETRADEGGLDKYRGTERQRGQGKMVTSWEASVGLWGILCGACSWQSSNGAKVGRGMARVTVHCQWQVSHASPALPHQEPRPPTHGRQPLLLLQHHLIALLLVQLQWYKGVGGRGRGV